jgi:hypothetical protein
LFRFGRALSTGASEFRAVKVERRHTLHSAVVLVGLVVLASLAGLAILIGSLFELRRATRMRVMPD